MRFIKGLGLALVAVWGCAGIWSAAEASTITSTGPASGVCTANPDCELAFALPGDFNVQIVETFDVGDVGSGFTTAYEFTHSSGSGAFSFNTANFPIDFPDLEFVVTSLSIGTQALTLGALNIISLAAGELVTLTVSASDVASADSNYTFTLRPVPVPPALLLLGSGLFGLGVLARRRRKAEGVASV